MLQPPGIKPGTSEHWATALPMRQLVVYAAKNHEQFCSCVIEIFYLYLKFSLVVNRQLALKGIHIIYLSFMRMSSGVVVVYESRTKLVMYAQNVMYVYCCT